MTYVILEWDDDEDAAKFLALYDELQSTGYISDLDGERLTMLIAMSDSIVP
jgi:hypothetical protein